VFGYKNFVCFVCFVVKNLILFLAKAAKVKSRKNRKGPSFVHLHIDKLVHFLCVLCVFAVKKSTANSCSSFFLAKDAKVVNTQRAEG